MTPNRTDIEARTPRHYPISGWIEAGLYVFAIAFLSLAYVVGHRLGAHPIAFVLYAMLVSALVLLAVTGPGPDALRIILAPQSWLVGVGTIGMEIFYYMLLEQALAGRGQPAGAPLHPAVADRRAGRCSRRRPRADRMDRRRSDHRGPPAAAVPARSGAIAPRSLTAVAGSAFAFNLRGFSAEFHPWNRRAGTITEKLRITGLVVLVTSMASLALAGGCALLVGLGVLPPIPMVPTAAQMLHVPTILLGVLVGGVILTAMAFLNFSCVVKITTENFAATSAFTPVAALLVQWPPRPSA